MNCIYPKASETQANPIPAISSAVIQVLVTGMTGIGATQIPRANTTDTHTSMMGNVDEPETITSHFITLLWVFLSVALTSIILSILKEEVVWQMTGNFREYIWASELN